MTRYVVASSKPCDAVAFGDRAPSLPGEWRLIDQRKRLTAEVLARFDPRYVFFPSWFWRVPDEIVDSFECVCFHMTDVPYGRGGSPLQNLILCGHQETRISALRMTHEMDAGPVYLKRSLSLDGRAQEIYERASEIMFGMMAELAAGEPTPRPQKGKPTNFLRRTPDQSLLPREGTLKGLYDHIRMLDAETYPHAFVEHGSFRIELSHAVAGEDVLEAKVVIRKRNGD